MIETLLQFDHDLFLRINRGLSNGFFDWLMPLMRNRFFWSPLYLFIIIFCIKEYKKKGFLIIGMILLTFAIGDAFSSRCIKPFVARPRPCNDIVLSTELIHRVPCGSGYSFPSAHATNHFGIAVFLILIFYDRWKPILPIGLAWAFIISFAQIYVGVHYPIDTLAGAVLGTLLGLLTSTIYKKLQNRI
ncbi:phosphatase PAP2 family protein [Pedobacter sp.]|jgi:membrane-associated phospholipid phosphatase|uniref:phosphatase PAP2 family protein n=1 Tax=Pedobacter sp. TaxID=1411316 RepID=UPI002BA4A49D|nr:phosphatase PAP2 family protein [Pedobacter sp.]HWW42843.1 phosphatase PAP2 family protein [Pedobacter sp.]